MTEAETGAIIAVISKNGNDEEAAGPADVQRTGVWCKSGDPRFAVSLPSWREEGADCKDVILSEAKNLIPRFFVASSSE